MYDLATLRLKAKKMVMSKSDVRKAYQLVFRHLKSLRKAWEEIHGDL
jgi:hypothetical protein